MGEVWRATDVLLRREIAVKVLLPALVSDEAFIARFRIEARMMAALRHPGIVQVHDYGENAEVDGNRLDFLVMEYIEGSPLSKWIKTVGRLGIAETISVITQAARALHVAHAAGIVHRDVKPSNLLVRPDGVIVLVDFGVARSADASGMTSTNMVLGTAHYMAPEQALGRPVSAETDVYALGAVAYCCLTGRPPFIGDNPLQVVSQHLQGEPPALPAGIPAPVAALVNRALAKDPAARYPSAAAFADAADAAARQPAPPALPAAPTPPALPAAPAAAAPAAAAPIAAAPAVSPPPPPPAVNVGAGSVGPAPAPAGSNRRRHAALAGVAGAVVLVLAGIAALFAYLPAEAQSRTQPATTLPVGSAAGSAPPGAEAGASGPGASEPGVDPAQPTSSASARTAQTATAGTPAKSTAPTAKTSRTTTTPTTGTSSPEATATSTATTSPTNPYTPAQVCGSGYAVIDSAKLTDSDGTLLGRVYLLYNSSTTYNCTTTMKTASVGTKTTVSTYLEVQGSARSTESGSFSYYAGPVRAKAPSTCVKWGGAMGGVSYGSPFEHCD